MNKERYTVWSQWDEVKDNLASKINESDKNVITFAEIGNNTSHSASNITLSGVKWTNNGDGTITAKRVETSASDSSCNIRTSKGSLYIDNYCNGDYVLSGCPGTGGTLMRALKTTESGEYRATDSGRGVTLVDKGTFEGIYINMFYPSDFDGEVVFKPMVCEKVDFDITDQFVEYRPYVVVNGTRIYVSNTVPTGDIPDGSIGIGW